MISSYAKSEPLKISSSFYLGAFWFQTVMGIFNGSQSQYEPNGVITFFYFISSLSLFVVGLTTWILVWQWMSIIYDSASRFGMITYSRGWTLWSWIVPVVQFWFPKEIIQQSYEKFRSKNQSAPVLHTQTWWNLYIAHLVIGWFAGMSGIVGAGPFAAFLQIASALILSFAYKPWANVVDQVSNVEAASIDNSSQRENQKAFNGMVYRNFCGECGNFVPAAVSNCEKCGSTWKIRKEVPANQLEIEVEKGSNIKNAEFKICPFCAEEIKFEAIKCKHCQTMLDK